MNEPISEAKVELLSWLAFLGTFCAINSLVFVWPWLRDAAATDAAIVVASMSGGAFCASVFIGLAVRDCVKYRLGARDPRGQLRVARTGCLFVALPSSFIAFFCTCAPLGILAGAESSVRPVEKSWTNEIWIAAWVIGVIAAISVGIAKRKQRDE